MLVESLINLLIITLIIVAIYMIFTGSLQGNTKIIAIVVIVILVIFLIVKSDWFKNESKLNKSVKNADKMRIKDYKKLKQYENNYTYCVWIYIDDWNYKYGEKKRILTRRDNSNGATNGNGGFNPDMYLSPLQNDLNIEIDCYDPETSGSVKHNCMIENINLQKWVCVLTVLNTRSLDVYINGKLARTCVLPGVPRVNNNSDLYITPGIEIDPNAVCGDPPSGDNLCGFGGFVGRISFFPSAKNPQEAWDIYREGPGTSILGNLLNKYQMKFIFSEDGKEKTEFNIL